MSRTDASIISRSVVWLLGSGVWTLVALFLSAIAIDTAIGPAASGPAVILVAGVWVAVAAIGSFGLAMAIRLVRRGGHMAEPLSILCILAATFATAGYGVWAIARYMTLDPDLLGRGPIIAFATVGCGVFGAASRWVVRPASAGALVLAMVCVSVLVVAGIDSLPGLSDGPSVEGLWLGAGVGATILVTCVALIDHMRGRSRRYAGDMA